MDFLAEVRVQSPNYLNGNMVREIGLKGGLADVKVAAVDETWPA